MTKQEKAKKLLKDIWDELKQFLSGKTIDALIPPIIYIIGNGLFGLKEGVLTRTIEWKSFAI